MNSSEEVLWISNLRKKKFVTLTPKQRRAEVLSMNPCLRLVFVDYVDSAMTLKIMASS